MKNERRLPRALLVLVLLSALSLGWIGGGCASSATDSSEDHAAGDDESPTPEPDDDSTADDDDDNDDDDNDDDDNDDDDDDDDSSPWPCVPPVSGPRTALQAGVAVGDLYAPIGGSMGGYGSRPGPEHPYALAMGASTGYFGKPNVKAVALDNGETRLVIARISAAGVSEYLYREVLNQVCETAGVDLTGRLWLSATHDHSGPAHYIPVPVILGGVGTDVFDRNYTRRIAASIAATIRQSLDGLEPAALATTVETPFDPLDTWSADRRCNNDPPRYKEDRLFLARLDRADGSPLAALVSFPDHGVWMGNTRMSTDLPGAIEEGFQKTFADRIEAFFLQGPTGDVNPSATPHGHNDEQGMEWHAQSISPVLRAVYDDLHPTTDVDLGMATRPLHVSREEIGYAADEFGWRSAWSGEFHPYPDGAFYCGSPDVWASLPYLGDHGSVVDCNEPSTQLVDGYYGCVLPLWFIDAWWTWALNPTEVAAVKLGDTLLALIPGELTSWLAKRLRENLSVATGIPDDRLATFGYSNGFQSYLLTEWDWLQGGYETSMNMWGPKYGDWLVDRDVELAVALLAGEAPVYPEPAPPSVPWPDFLPTGFETAEAPGDALEQVQATYRRFETVSFSWAGGFTGVDFPQVAFERESGGEFAPVLLPGDRPLTDQCLEVRLDYEAVPGYDELPFPASRTHRYTIRWELTADTPPGRYRLRVQGHTWTGAETVEYETLSATFEVQESDQVQARDLTVVALGGEEFEIRCDAFWPPNPDGYRLRHPDYGSAEWSAVTGGQAVATIEVEGGHTETVDLTADALGRFTGTWRRTQTGLPHTVIVYAGDLSDGFGNSNEADTEPVSVP